MNVDGMLDNSFWYYLALICSGIIVAISTSLFWTLRITGFYADVPVGIPTYIYVMSLFGGGWIVAWVIGQKLSKHISRGSRVKRIAREGGGSTLDAVKRTFRRHDFDRKRYKVSRPMGLHFYRSPYVLMTMFLSFIILLVHFYFVNVTFYDGNSIWEVFTWDALLIALGVGGTFLLSCLAYKLDIRRMPANYSP
jgi:hypothetical protein